MHSASQLWKWSKIRRLIVAAAFGMTFIGTDTGEVQPATQVGGLQRWDLVKFTYLLFQSETETFFLFLFLFNFTSSLLKWDTSSHTAPSALAASLCCPWREKHKVTSPDASWAFTVAVAEWGELGSHRAALDWRQPKTPHSPCHCHIPVQANGFIIQMQPAATPIVRGAEIFLKWQHIASRWQNQFRRYKSTLTALTWKIS